MLLYDEPTAGLDPIASTVVEDLIRSVHVTGKDALGKPGNIASYVVVTHQHSTIRRAVDRFWFLFLDMIMLHILQTIIDFEVSSLQANISLWREGRLARNDSWILYIS